MTFLKATFNQKSVSEQDYINMFSEMGFEAKNVNISFTNGLSAYISLNVNVLDANKMYSEVFVYENKASIQVRISDHLSNLEMICGGVSNNKMSFEAFKSLVNNKVIS